MQNKYLHPSVPFLPDPNAEESENKMVCASANIIIDQLDEERMCKRPQKSHSLYTDEQHKVVGKFANEHGLRAAFCKFF